jgi:hypothetical protein
MACLLHGSVVVLRLALAKAPTKSYMGPTVRRDERWSLRNAVYGNNGRMAIVACCLGILAWSSPEKVAGSFGRRSCCAPDGGLAELCFRPPTTHRSRRIPVFVIFVLWFPTNVLGYISRQGWVREAVKLGRRFSDLHTARHHVPGPPPSSVHFPSNGWNDSKANAIHLNLNICIVRC